MASVDTNREPLFSRENSASRLVDRTNSNTRVVDTHNRAATRNRYYSVVVLANRRETQLRRMDGHTHDHPRRKPRHTRSTRLERPEITLLFFLHFFLTNINELRTNKV